MALKMVCEKCGLKWLYQYCDELDWYDSDVFAEILLERVKDTKNWSEEDLNSYYAWLITKDGEPDG